MHACHFSGESTDICWSLILFVVLFGRRPPKGAALTTFHAGHNYGKGKDHNYAPKSAQWTTGPNSRRYSTRETRVLDGWVSHPSKWMVFVSFWIAENWSYQNPRRKLRQNNDGMFSTNWYNRRKWRWSLDRWPTTILRFNIFLKKVKKKYF